MAEVARWRSHVWGAFGTVIRSFTDLTMSAGCTTESKGSEETYSSFKASSPMALGMSVILMKTAGCEPMAEVQTLMTEASNGETGYMYIGGELVATCKLMLTKVSVSDTELTPNGEMISCKAALTFAQSTMLNGKTAGSKSKDSDTDTTNLNTYTKGAIDLLTKTWKVTLETASQYDSDFWAKNFQKVVHTATAARQTKQESATNSYSTAGSGGYSVD